MAVESYEWSSADSLREQIATLEAQLADLKKQLEWSSTETPEVSESTDDAGTNAAIDALRNFDATMVTNSVSRPVVDRLRLYRWGRESITQQQVMDIVNGLKEPYNSEVSGYIEQNDILWLQKYLNSKIDSWEIDLPWLREALKKRKIWLENDRHIKEDDKFWPQTLE